MERETQEWMDKIGRKCALCRGEADPYTGLIIVDQIFCSRCARDIETGDTPEAAAIATAIAS